MSGYKAGDLAAYFAAKNKDVVTEKQTKGGKKVANLLSRGMNSSPAKKNSRSMKQVSALFEEDDTFNMESVGGARKNKKNKTQRFIENQSDVLIDNENMESSYNEAIDFMEKQEFQNERFLVNKKRKSMKLLQNSLEKIKNGATLENMSDDSPMGRKKHKKGQAENNGMADSTLKSVSKKKNKKNSMLISNSKSIRDDEPDTPIDEDSGELPDSPVNEDYMEERDFRKKGLKKRKNDVTSADMMNGSRVERMKAKKKLAKGMGDSTLQFGSKKKNRKNSVPGLNNEPELMKFSAKKDESSDEEEEDATMACDQGEGQSEEQMALKKIEVDGRTLFFGNIPLHMNKSDVTNVFQNFGKVKSLRFRSFIPVKANTPRKFAERRKECNENVMSHMGFVVFKKKEDAENALKLNGTVVNGNHIRVDWANFAQDNKQDHEHTVFVGNLPFTVSDEALWEKFSPCGDIVSVRVVRDKGTGLGKGFAYVRFKNKSSIQKALQLKGTDIEARNIRVQLCEYGGNAGGKSDTKGKFGHSRKHAQHFGKQFSGSKNSGGNMQEGNKKWPWSRGFEPRFNIRKEKNDFGISQESRKSFKKIMNKKKQERQKNKIAAILKQSVNSNSLGTISKFKTAKRSM